MTITLGPHEDVVEVEPPGTPVFVTVPPAATVTVAPPTLPPVLVQPPAVPAIKTEPPIDTTALVVPVAGPPGPAGGEPFVYIMPVAQTTALIAHDLGRDPVAVQVLLNGQQVDEFSVSFPSPGLTVLVGFDIAAQATIRLL